MPSILIRATASGNLTTVETLIKHPMDSGFVKDASGKLIPPHYIEVVEVGLNGKTVLTAFWGPAVSKDPFTKFSFTGGKSGDSISIGWVDNLGNKDSKTAQIS
ncbi:MAG TPA: thiosulfate oxidation carrier complex protein SoxZ [Acetobacteraceae bacterium]|nr:thiosulfate oxidation carrier complex protein SoxZ [Acetobacteraceae bacterium]